MKNLLITDLHFRTFSSLHDYLPTQVNAIDSIIEKEDPGHIWILGDVFNSRRPSPTVLLAVDRFLEKYKNRCTIIMGNHDAENKSDNGSTALSLYKHKARIFTKPEIVNVNKGFKIGLIPHFEQEDIIIEYIKKYNKKADMLFGHFGFINCINSIGNYDFSIDPSTVRIPTIVGHIHKHTRQHKITILGTQYTTSFNEAGKVSYYGVFQSSEPNLITYKETDLGPYHITSNISELDNLSIKNKNYVLLRVFIDPVINKDNVREQINSVCEKNPQIVYSDIKLRPLIEDSEMTNISKKLSKLSLDDGLIQEYIEANAQSDLAEEEMWAGYIKLKEAVRDKNREN